MDQQTLFSESIRKHFAYLIDEFGCSIVEDQYHPSSAGCVVAFQNKIRYVRLIWDLKDEELYFGVYRVLSNGEPAPSQDRGVHQFYISTLAKHYEPAFELRFLNELDPSLPDVDRLLDEKIGANAQLLRKYGNDILAGQQWFDQISQTLVSESALTHTESPVRIEKVPRPIPAEHRRVQTRGYYPLESPDPHPTLPMGLVLLIVGGIVLAVGALLVLVMMR